MRLYDAYRMGLLSLSDYQARLASGYTPQSLFDSIEHVYSGDIDNYITGISTNTLTSVLSYNIAYSNKQSVSVKNTGTTNSIDVVAEYYVTSILSKTITETVAPLATFFIETEYAGSAVIIKVVDTVLNSHSTFEVGTVTF
jgi:hypothetical protein